MSPSSKPLKIAVVGAGISGLSTAFAMKSAGHNVAIFESGDRAGGPIASTEKEGYRLEEGPHTLLVRTRAVAKVLEELDLTDRIVEAYEAASRRYVVKNGRPTALPSSPAEALTTPLLSPAARLRALIEPLVGRFDDPHIDETLAHFVTRRLGPEVLDYLVDPFVGGIWAGDPRLLSAKHAFPTLVEWEESAGSIVVGAIKKMLNSRGEEKTPRRLLSFDKGLGTLIEAFTDRLESELRVNTPVRKLRRDDDGWRVIYQLGKARRGETFDAVFLTIPAHALPDLEWENATPPANSMEELSTLPYAPCNLVHLGFLREDVQHPLDGLGVLIPRVENFHILGSLFISTMFPDRAPEGHVQLATFIGGTRQPQHTEADDQTLIEMACLDLGRLLGIDADPQFASITRYERAIPQFEVGHDVYRNHMSDIEAHLPGIFLAGNYHDGISVPDLLEAGQHHASRLQDAINTNNFLRR